MSVPKLRFPEFTDDWEQRKLGDLVVRYKELVPTPHNGYWKLSIRSHAKGTFLTYVEPGKELEERQLSKVKADQLMFNIVFAWEHAVAITSQEDTKALVSHRFPQFSFNKDLTPEFFRYVMLDERFRQHLWLASPSGAGRNKTLNIADALGYMFYIPSVSEQKKISEFLNTLDNTITLHQRKLEGLRILKKSMLQKMFPSEGYNVPEVRFPGFTAAWEQRKFGDVFEEYSEKNHEDLPPLTIVQGSGTIPREESGRDIKYDKSSLNNYKLVNPGDFILHLRSFEGGLEVANSQGIVSPAYHIFRGIRTDSRFYYPFFRSHDFINILLKPHVYGIRDGKSIDVEGMKSIKIPYPDFDEQKRIGDFFDHLDNAITLHQRKCDDLQKLKKALLQQMFC